MNKTASNIVSIKKNEASSAKKKEVYVVYFEAASGHLSAAKAIANSLNNNSNINAQILDITSIFDFHQPFGRIVRAGVWWFNFCLKRDILFDLGGLVNLSLMFHDLLSKKGLRNISNFWKNKQPDLVISVTPMYNPVLQKSLNLAHPKTKFLCIPVDLEEGKKRYWFTPKSDFLYATVSKKLREQAITHGISPNKIFPLRGMIADESAKQSLILNKTKLFQNWKFNTTLPTVFVSFGGQGAVQVLRIAKEANRQKIAANFIFMCGKDKHLFERMNNLKTSYPKKVFAYTKETPIQYLLLSDIAVGKPGAMTLAEAQLAKKPLFALKSTGLKLVQKGNEKYIEENGLGSVFPNITTLVTVLNFDKNKIKSEFEIPENQGIEDLQSLIGHLLKIEKTTSTSVVSEMRS